MLFAWIVMLGFLQSTAQLNVNFLVLFAILVGFKKGPVWGLLTGIFIGVFAEVLSSSAPGLNLMLYSAVGFLSGMIKQKIYYKEDVKMELIFSFFGMLFFYAGYFAFTKTAQADVWFTIIFSSLVSPLLFRLIE